MLNKYINRFVLLFVLILTVHAKAQTPVIVDTEAKIRNAMSDTNVSEILINGDITINGGPLVVKGNKKMIRWNKDVKITHTKSWAVVFRVENVLNFQLTPVQGNNSRLTVTRPTLSRWNDATTIDYISGKPNYIAFINTTFSNASNVFRAFSKDVDLSNMAMFVNNCSFWMFSHKAIFLSRMSQKFNSIRKMTIRNSLFRARVQEGFTRIRAISPDAGNDMADCVSSTKTRCTELQESNGSLGVGVVMVQSCDISNNNFYNCGIGAAHMGGLKYTNNYFQLDNNFANSRIDDLGSVKFKIVDYENDAKDCITNNNTFHLAAGAGRGSDGVGPDLSVMFVSSGSEWIDHDKDCTNAKTKNLKFNSNTITTAGDKWYSLAYGWGLENSEFKNNTLPWSGKFSNRIIDIADFHYAQTSVPCANSISFSGNTSGNNTAILNPNGVRTGSVFIPLTPLSKANNLVDSFSEEFQESKVTVFPKTTDYQLFVNGLNVGLHRAEIFNATGQLVKKLSLVDEVDVSFLSKGIYLISIDGGKAHRFVKK